LITADTVTILLIIWCKDLSFLLAKIKRIYNETAAFTYSAVGMGKVDRYPVQLIEHLGKDDDSSIELAEVRH